MRIICDYIREEARLQLVMRERILAVAAIALLFVLFFVVDAVVANVDYVFDVFKHALRCRNFVCLLLDLYFNIYVLVFLAFLFCFLILITCN